MIWAIAMANQVPTGSGGREADNTEIFYSVTISFI
jgi:hypothetical protein